MLPAQRRPFLRARRRRRSAPGIAAARRGFNAGREARMKLFFRLPAGWQERLAALRLRDVPLIKDRNALPAATEAR